jgi:5-formyltetrahydrofolate cyclo-ligase
MSVPLSADALHLAKRAVRESVLRQRDAMSPSQRAKDSERCAQRLMTHRGVETASMLLSYMSFGTELETSSVFTIGRAQGKNMALPRMASDEAARTPTLVLHPVNDLSELVDGIWGIREPAAQARVVGLDAIDVAVVPGVAFDRAGRRLGYGKGYYDRLLATRPASLLVVALAFDCQLVDEVPVSEHDVPIDVLITPSQQLTFTT